MTEPADRPRPAPLFRTEALQHHTQRLHGNVKIYTPMSWHIVGMLLLALLIVSAAFLSFASYSRVRTVTGVVTLDRPVSRVAVDRAGTIDRLSVAEGQSVHMGQALAEIRPTSRADSANALRGDIVVAPVDGTIATLQVRAGSAARPNRPLMTIIPSPSRPRVELFVPSEVVGYIAAGDDIELSLDAFPYRRFGTLSARVTSIGQLPAKRPDAGNAGPVHIVTASIPRAWIEGTGRRRAILPGMTLSARIVTERRTLIEWLFGPRAG